MTNDTEMQEEETATEYQQGAMDEKAAIIAFYYGKAAKAEAERIAFVDAGRMDRAVVSAGRVMDYQHIIDDLIDGAHHGASNE